ncbi:MAG: hypothetical protein ACKVP1_13900, partial [Burkholderiaceae bacterium]
MLRFLWPLIRFTVGKSTPTQIAGAFIVRPISLDALRRRVEVIHRRVRLRPQCRRGFAGLLLALCCFGFALLGGLDARLELLATRDPDDVRLELVLPALLPLAASKALYRP